MVNEITFFIKKHFWGIFLSLFVGIISFLPNLIVRYSDYYQGLPIISTDAETLYLSRINGVYKGCVLSCNPYVKEYSNKFPHFDASLAEPILALPGIIFGLSTLDLKFFYEFFLLFLLFLICYFLIYRITLNIWISILGTLFIVVGYNLLNTTDLLNITDIIDLFRFKTQYEQFLIFSRPVNPQFSTIYFFIYLHVLLSSIRSKKSTWFIILSLVYALSFYIYFFTYAFITVVQGVWIVLSLIIKEWKYLKYFLISTITGLFIAIPQFIEIYKLLNHPLYETIPNEYLILTHMPHISILGLILFIVFISLSFLYVKKHEIVTSSGFLIFSLIISCFITRNEHILSGMIMQYNHFEVYLFAPVFVIAICYAVVSFIDKKYLVKYRYLIILLMLIPILNACLIQYKSYIHWLPYVQSSQKYVPVLEWLKNDIPPGSVISSPPDISRYVSLYTLNYVLWTHFASNWIYYPQRYEDAVLSRESVKRMEEVGRKYGVDYYVVEKMNNEISIPDTDRIILYKDNNYWVYTIK